LHPDEKHSLPDKSPHLESTQPLALLGVQPLPNEIASDHKEGRPVTRFPEQLRPHRSLDEIGWTDTDDLNQVARRKVQPLPDPVLITKNGIILSGIGSWRLALSEHRQHISCIEYDVDEDESLQYVLAIHRTRSRWNSFVLIRLALTLEPYFQQKALDNMRTGGRFKGSTNLSKADRIDVRREIATAAGSGTGNVNKVKAILRNAHPYIIAALQNGSLRIHRAWKWCSLSKGQQKEKFAAYEDELTRRKILREFGYRRSQASFDPRQVLGALQFSEARHPGQIVVRGGTRKKTVVILGTDFIEEFRTIQGS
jgi:hypothetical protein